MVDTVTYSGTFALTGEGDTTDFANGDLEFFNLFFCVSVTANLEYSDGALIGGYEHIVALWKSTAGNDGRDSTGVYDDQISLYPNGNTLVVGDGTPSYSYYDSLAYGTGDWVGDFHFLLTQQLDPNANQILLHVAALADIWMTGVSIADLAGNYTLALGNSPPVPAVAASNITATKGQVFAAVNLLTAGDPDGDAITQYNFWDSGLGGAYFTLGSQVEPSKQNITVSASQLAQTSYHSGFGSDVVWVQVSDGSQWSPWVSFTVTGPADTPPVVAASNRAAAEGQVFSAASLVSASDPDGDSITDYNFWDTGSGGAFFTVGSQLQGAKQNITLSPAQLAQTNYHSGSGSDVIWVQASDGTQWSPWVSFTVTGPVQTPPTVTVSNLSAWSGQLFSATNLVSATDSDGDNVASYTFWDTGAGGAQFLVSGQPQNAKANIALLPSQLAQASYQAGSGSDVVWVQASDGTLTSPWVSFTVTPPPPTPPTVTVSNLSARTGRLLPAASLASATDADGDAIASYAFWDTGTGGAQFLVGGQPQNAKTNITLLPSQLAQANYQAGSGSDVVWVQASDGTLTSPWVSFTVSPAPDTPPIAQGANVETVAGQLFSGTIVSASDPDGDAIAGYNLWETGNSGAQLLLNGVAQTAKQNVTVSSSQLDQIAYESGTGSDVLWIQANDGTQWGAWAQLAFASINPAMIAAGATLDLASTYTGAVTFAASTGTLRLENSASFQGTVTGFSAQDTLDFADINPALLHSLSFSGTSTSGTLTVSDGTHSAAIALNGDYLLSRFLPSSDGHGGTLVSVKPMTVTPQTLAPPLTAGGGSFANANDPSAASATLMGFAYATAGLTNSSGAPSIGAGMLGTGNPSSDNYSTTQLLSSSSAIDH